LKNKTVNGFAAAVRISERNFKRAGVQYQKKLLRTAFKHFRSYVRVFLYKKKKVRQYRILSMKCTLKKIMKSWLYFVRPSAKFLKIKPQDPGTSVDKLLSKIKKKDQEIKSYFRKYKKKSSK